MECRNCEERRRNFCLSPIVTPITARLCETRDRKLAFPPLLSISAGPRTGRDRIECLTIGFQPCSTPREILPASDNHIAEARIDFEQSRLATELFGGDQRRAGAGE